LEQKIEVFLGLLRQRIVDLSEEEYAKQVDAVILSFSQKPKYLGAEAWEYWQIIQSARYKFSSRTLTVFRKTTKSSRGGSNWSSQETYQGDGAGSV
jgi:secreted Zn-dependent insulinase-like peptidase